MGAVYIIGLEEEASEHGRDGEILAIGQVDDVRRGGHGGDGGVGGVIKEDK